MFPQDFPLPKHLSLISDQLSSPADFLLHQTLASQLKASKDAKCIVLSVSEDWARWKAIAAKSSLNLDQWKTFGALKFIDVPAHILQAAPDTIQSMRPIFDTLATTLADTLTRNALVILDDIASLEWIGLSLTDLTRFIRAVSSLCFKYDAALVVRHHIVTPDAPDVLFRALLQLCSHHIEVLPLASGRSGAVSGEVAVHSGPLLRGPAIAAIPRARAIQYRVTDGGAVYFERGTGGGVL